MALYSWFSAEVMNHIHGQEVKDPRDGQVKPQQGYGIAINTKTDELVQYCSADRKKPSGWIAKLPDLEVQSFASDKDVQQAVDAFGAITPHGEEYCKRHNLPVGTQSLIDKTKNFVKPDPSKKNTNIPALTGQDDGTGKKKKTSPAEASNFVPNINDVADTTKKSLAARISNSKIMNLPMNQTLLDTNWLGLQNLTGITLRISCHNPFKGKNIGGKVMSAIGKKSPAPAPK